MLRWSPFETEPSSSVHTLLRRLGSNRRTYGQGKTTQKDGCVLPPQPCYHLCPVTPTFVINRAKNATPPQNSTLWILAMYDFFYIFCAEVATTYPHNETIKTWPTRDFWFFGSGPPWMSGETIKNRAPQKSVKSSRKGPIKSRNLSKHPILV